VSFTGKFNMLVLSCIKNCYNYCYCVFFSNLPASITTIIFNIRYRKQNLNFHFTKMHVLFHFKRQNYSSHALVYELMYVCQFFELCRQCWYRNKPYLQQLPYCNKRQQQEYKRNHRFFPICFKIDAFPDVLSLRALMVIALYSNRSRHLLTIKIFTYTSKITTHYLGTYISSRTK